MRADARERTAACAAAQARAASSSSSHSARAIPQAAPVPPAERTSGTASAMAISTRAPVSLGSQRVRPAAISVLCSRPFMKSAGSASASSSSGACVPR